MPQEHKASIKIHGFLNDSMLPIIIASAFAAPSVVHPEYVYRAEPLPLSSSTGPGPVMSVAVEVALFGAANFEGGVSAQRLEYVYRANSQGKFLAQQPVQCKDADFKDDTGSAQWKAGDERVGSKICFWENESCYGNGICWDFKVGQDSDFARWRFNNIISSYSVEVHDEI